MIYADYDYYKNTYNGTISEDSFNSLAIKASRIIDANINVRLTEDLISELLEDEAQAQLKAVVCALVDLINRKEESQNRNVSSISIDGVSKTYSAISVSDYNNEKKDILALLPFELTCYI